MTRRQYKQLKQEAWRDAIMNEFGIGFARYGDYVVVYSAYNGYDASNNPIISRHSDFYRYVYGCRQLAQVNPDVADQLLADCRAFLEAYKK